MKTKNTYKFQEEIYFKDLIIIAWNYKFSIFLITAFFSLASVIYSLQIPNMYKSEALMSLADANNGSSDISRYSGLASLAGINLPQSATEDKISLAIENIRSREMVERLIKDESILVGLMAAKGFNWTTKTLEIDESIYDVSNSNWLRKPAGPFKERPSLLEAHRVYSKALSIKREGTFFTIAIEHISPIFAKTLLTKIIKETNNINIEKDKQESYLALQYLASESSKTSVQEIRDSINALISAQLQTQMLANIREEYLIKAIDRPYVPEFKTAPNRAVLCIIGTIFGFIFGLIFTLIRLFVSQNRLKEEN
jgi:hypothetical protein